MTIIIVEKDLLPDGTKIQIEDWSTEYSFMPYGRTVASYPKSKANHKGDFSPKIDKLFRCAFDFNSHAEAKNAYDELLSGSKTLSDYKNFLQYKENQNCI